MSEYKILTQENHDARHEITHDKSVESKVKESVSGSEVESLDQKLEKLRESTSELYQDQEQDEIKKKMEDTLELKKQNTISTVPVSSYLRELTSKQELNRIRNQLNPIDSLGSIFIHQKAIRAISEASSKTIARPSGIVGGGIIALLGTTSYYIFSKHVGIKYNYLIFLILFISGFVAGIFIELLILVIRSRLNKT